MARSVRLQTGESTDVADPQSERIVRAVFERRDARVGSMQRIALVAVICFAAFTEERVAPEFRFCIERLYGLLQTSRIDTHLPGQFADGGCPRQITRAQIAPDRQREWRRTSKPIFTQRLVVANQMR